MEVPKKLKMTFQIQKNRQNGQSIMLVADNAHQDICPVWAARRIFLRAEKLGRSDSEPMGVFVNKFGIKKISHRRQDCQGTTIRCKESPPGLVCQQIELQISTFGPSLGPHTLRRSWNESSFHDILIMLDGRFLQAVLARYLHPAT